jgi:hypothetical protein
MSERVAPFVAFAIGAMNCDINTAEHRVKAKITNNLAFTSAHLLTPMRLQVDVLLNESFLKLCGIFPIKGRSPFAKH